jgi:hypothetical protein
MDSGFTIDIFKLFFENRVIGVIVINVFFMAVYLSSLGPLFYFAPRTKLFGFPIFERS